MNYQQTLEYLYSQLPMFQRVGPAAYKADLKNTLALDKLLNHPHQHFQSIHIAGTNGKGSVSHLIASVLQAKGLKAALYTSPHLKDFRERIKVNGKNVTRNYVTSFVEQYQTEFNKIKPSFFEMTFSMAMQYFAEQKVDIAVIETGMGGRLDSTNIVHPILTIITNIGYDHTQFLGNTLQQIASEKAGIIKPNIPLVLGESQTITDSVFEETAEINHSPMYFADQRYKAINIQHSGSANAKLLMDIIRNERVYIKKLRCPLLGYYQTKNIVTSLSALELLVKAGYDIRKIHITKGINDVIKNTGIQGRWQVIQQEPLCICDVAHNKDGIKEVVGQLEKLSYSKLHVVLGSVFDKESDEVLKLLPKTAVYYFCRANVPRGMQAKALKEKANVYGLIGDAYPDVQTAYEKAQENAGKNDLVFVGGSTFVVAEIL